MTAQIKPAILQDMDNTFKAGDKVVGTFKGVQFTGVVTKTRLSCPVPNNSSWDRELVYVNTQEPVDTFAGRQMFNFCFTPGDGTVTITKVK